MNYETKLSECGPVVKQYPCTNEHGRWNMEQPDLEENSANARKDVIDVILAGQEGADRETSESIALSLRGKILAIRTSTAATHDGVSIRTSCSWFASTSNFGLRHS